MFDASLSEIFMLRWSYRGEEEKETQGGTGPCMGE